MTNLGAKNRPKINEKLTKLLILGRLVHQKLLKLPILGRLRAILGNFEAILGQS
jgi:hypothetical protein